MNKYQRETQTCSNYTIICNIYVCMYLLHIKLNGTNKYIYVLKKTVFCSTKNYLNSKIYNLSFNKKKIKKNLKIIEIELMN